MRIIHAQPHHTQHARGASPRNNHHRHCCPFRPSNKKEKKINYDRLSGGGVAKKAKNTTRSAPQPTRLLTK